VGGQIDTAVLEMWEESLDGSGKIMFNPFHPAFYQMLA